MENEEKRVREMMIADTVANSGVHEFTFSFAELAITAHAVARGLGYTEIPEHLIDAINEALPAAGRVARPRGGFRIFPPSAVSIVPGVIHCNGTELLTGKVIAKRLRPSSALAVFVATAGPDLEAWSRELMDSGDMMQGFIVDTIGSEVVERVGDALERKLEAIIAPTYRNTTNKYSPGYCKWPVFEQHKLFSLLPAEFCGVRLTDSALMMPMKSMSGIVGLGPDTFKKDYECSLCDMENCYRRRAPFRPEEYEDEEQ